MSEKAMTRVSLAELQARKARGESKGDPNAPERDVFDRGFWDKAEARMGKGDVQSVHLKLDRDVFEFFKVDGKGHITRMQNVLKAYVRAHR